MKKRLQKYLGIIFLLGLSCSIHAQFKAKGLAIEITGLRNDKGKVLISVFNSADGFPEKTVDAVYTAEARSRNGRAYFVYENIKAGIYAIAVLHDENENMKMDTKTFGLPKEGYGFSKNAMGTFGPPAFKKANFSYPGQTEISIKVKY